MLHSIISSCSWGNTDFNFSIPSTAPLINFEIDFCCSLISYDFWSACLFEGVIEEFFLICILVTFHTVVGVMLQWFEKGFACYFEGLSFPFLWTFLLPLGKNCNNLRFSSCSFGGDFLISFILDLKASTN